MRAKERTRCDWGIGGAGITARHRAKLARAGEGLLNQANVPDSYSNSSKGRMIVLKSCSHSDRLTRPPMMYSYLPCLSLR